MTRASLSEGILPSNAFSCFIWLKIIPHSLPANIDQAELSRLLSEHLADHTDVKYVKVIRDSKGGVCAFVQCEVGFSTVLT